MLSQDDDHASPLAQRVLVYKDLIFRKSLDP